MSERAALSPREWIGEAAWPWPAAAQLPEGEVLRACYCVVELTLARTRNEQEYLRLTLTDRHGSIEARLWENAADAAAALRPGVYVGVDGRIERHNGAPQICIDALAAVHVQLEELELFLPRSARSDQDMNGELQAFIASVEDPAFHALLSHLLGPDAHVGHAFRLAPAAKQNHHAFLGGLLEHTLSVTRVCDLLAGHYGEAIDRDLLVTAALLHDVGKVREIGARAGFPYTDEGKLLGHILIGLQIVHEAAVAIPELTPARRLLLEHLIAAHQGRFEWQSPREPSILEGIILHYADDLDAKFQQVSEVLDRAPGAWSGWDRSFRREFLRHRRSERTDAERTDTARTDTGRTGTDGAEETNTERTDPERTVTDGVDGATAGERTGGRGGSDGYRAVRLSDDTLDLFGDR